MSTAMFDLAKQSCRDIKRHEILHGITSPELITFYNNWLAFVLKNFSDGDIVKLLRIALVEYNLQMLPKDITMFDEIHEKYGKKLLGVEQ
jgi:hypothetical protein